MKNVFQAEGLSTKYLNLANCSIVQIKEQVSHLPAFEEDNGFLWVRADKTFTELYRYLGGHRMIMVAPSYPESSLGGAFLLGVHGSISIFGSFCNQVFGVEFLDSNSVLHKIEDDEAELNAISCSLGLVGPVLRLKIKTYSSKSYAVVYGHCTFKDFLEEVGKECDNTIGKTFWFEASSKKVKYQKIFLSEETQVKSGTNYSTIVKPIFELGVSLRSFVPQKIRSKISDGLFPYLTSKNQVIGNGIHTSTANPFISSHEICIAKSKSQEVISGLYQDINEIWPRTSHRSPIVIRFTSPDRALISPTALQNSIWIDFNTTQPNEKGLESLRIAEDWHRENFDFARPHWGKWYTKERYDFRTLYANLPLFQKTLQKYSSFHDLAHFEH
jgi:hypothetical protein